MKYVKVCLPLLPELLLASLSDTAAGSRDATADEDGMIRAAAATRTRRHSFTDDIISTLTSQRLRSDSCFDLRRGTAAVTNGRRLRHFAPSAPFCHACPLLPVRGRREGAAATAASHRDSATRRFHPV